LALDGGEWSPSRPGRSTTITTRYEAGCAPEPVWTRWQR